MTQDSAPGRRFLAHSLGWPPRFRLVRRARGGRERRAPGRRRALQINRDAGGVGRVSAADTVCLHYELMDISGVALMKRPKNDCGGTGEVHRAKFERMMDGWSRVLQNRSVFL